MKRDRCCLDQFAVAGHSAVAGPFVAAGSGLTTGSLPGCRLQIASEVKIT